MTALSSHRSGARTRAPGGEKKAIFRETYKRRHGLFLVSGILGITGMSTRETGVLEEGARFEVRVPSRGWRFGGGGVEGSVVPTIFAELH